MTVAYITEMLDDLGSDGSARAANRNIWDIEAAIPAASLGDAPAPTICGAADAQGTAPIVGDPWNFEDTEELLLLRAENRRLRLGRDMLSMAAAWFARHDPTAGRLKFS